jgi:hypothetical protein
VGEVLAQRFPNGLCVGGLALVVAVSLASKKKASVVNVVQHKKPPLPTVTQPVVHQLKDIRRRISPSDLDPVGNVAKALLEPSGVAGIDPEHPHLARLLACAIGIFDGELRLASLLLARGAG